jgi:hydrogenase/urease accessory protein HupE
MTKAWIVVGWLLALPLPAATAFAHESRPAYLQINETTAGVYEINWRRPALGDRVLSLRPVFPAPCQPHGRVANYLSQGAQVQRWTLQCPPAGLVGGTVSIDGLAQTLTDVLVRIQFRDGTVLTRILKPTDPGMVVPGTPSVWRVIADYLVLGVGHILGGIDHLLFVLCLLLIVQSNLQLVKTITAFTLAHSMTLGLATLGYVHVPQAPVEAAIALSILFLAVELVKQQQGKKDLAMRAPWLVAFVFGLLHGFGFAGALAEVGLPSSDIPLALLMFNVGVEAGQLLFIGSVLLVIRLWRQVFKAELHWLARATAYAIGGVSSFWIFARMALF